jgi:dTDP-4-dehydrorhamnose 3,5-epimerase
MRVRPGELHGVLVFEPTPVSDDRGFFTRTFDTNAAADAGLDVASFVQDSQSRSFGGVVRGLHYRRDGGEGKLVRCSYGRVYDVAVDIRPWSPTYLRHQAVVLDDVDHVALFLPAGLAHGFQALTDVADVCYRIDAEHRPEADAGIAWDDPDLGIAWPEPVTLLSDRDRQNPRLSHVLTLLHDAAAGGGIELDRRGRMSGVVVGSPPGARTDGTVRPPQKKH